MPQKQMKLHRSVISFVYVAAYISKQRQSRMRLSVHNTQTATSKKMASATNKV